MAEQGPKGPQATAGNATVTDGRPRWRKARAPEGAGTENGTEQPL